MQLEWGKNEYFVFVYNFIGSKMSICVSMQLEWEKNEYFVFVYNFIGNKMNTS